MEKTHVIPSDSGDITLSTGKLAQLAAGSVTITKGGTVILATASVDPNPTEKDFFPLTVEYLERFYAGGTLSGSRFNKREGFPNEDAIITARQIDHSIRPLFPKAFKHPVNVILTLLANDGVNDPRALTVLGASVALMISGIPFAGPAASAMVGVKADGSIVINPAVEKVSSFVGEFEISAADGKLLNIEGWGKELTNEQMDEVLDAALAEIANLNAEQLTFAKGIAKPTMSVPDAYVNQDVVAQLMDKHTAEISKAAYVEDKATRTAAVAELKTKLAEQYATEESEVSKGAVGEAVEYVLRKIMRSNIMESDKRFSGRKLDEIRALAAEVDVLPTVHGSALFNRGLTQSLSIVTLGSTAKSKGFDDMIGEDTIVPFMHHYNFPPYSTGEAGRVNYKPGRREIGHGAIGQNGLKNIVPSQEDFPYTIRVVSEILTSNGSTSMAATCAASMALMAAGVPMKGAVAGIGVGLVTTDESQKEYKLVLDIEGDEDFYGDMDFKVTGTKDGLTAIQFETKLQGVKPEIIKESFRLSLTGRLQVLDAMNKAIKESRADLSENAPRVEVIQIPVDKIGELIGPGGKIVKAIVADASKEGEGQIEIDIDDSGRVTITANSKAQRDVAVERVNMIIEGPKVGEIYEGKVTKIVEFGAFVEIAPGLEGLLHISEIDNKRVEKVTDYLTEGQMVRVKLVDKKPGRYSLSMKQVNE